MNNPNDSTYSIESQVSPSSAVLSQIAAPVDLDAAKHKETQELIDRMLKVAHGRQGDAKYPTLVGLAAPQIGVSERVIIIGVNSTGNGEKPEMKVFINPEFTAMSDETEAGREGCFSTGRVCGIVDRAKNVTLQAVDREDNTFSQTLEGFPARIAQHELDHLNGIRFPDRITDDSRLHWVEEAEFGDYRIRWKEWTVLCPRSRWEAIKSGAIQDH